MIFPENLRPKTIDIQKKLNIPLTVHPKVTDSPPHNGKLTFLKIFNKTSFTIENDTHLNAMHAIHDRSGTIEMLSQPS
jgi:hypothetical protein